MDKEEKDNQSQFRVRKYNFLENYCIFFLIFKKHVPQMKGIGDHLIFFSKQSLQHIMSSRMREATRRSFVFLSRSRRSQIS